MHGYACLQRGLVLKKYKGGMFREVIVNSKIECKL